MKFIIIIVIIIIIIIIIIIFMVSYRQFNLLKLWSSVTSCLYKIHFLYIR